MIANTIISQKKFIALPHDYTKSDFLLQTNHYWNGFDTAAL
jgi:hypothetical protein